MRVKRRRHGTPTQWSCLEDEFRTLRIAFAVVVPQRVFCEHASWHCPRSHGGRSWQRQRRRNCRYHERQYADRVVTQRLAHAYGYADHGHDGAARVADRSLRGCIRTR